MSYTDLPDLRRGFHNQTACVRVCRLWYYRGGLENGPIKLIHMVLLDAKRGDGYAIVPTSFVYSFVDKVQEWVVYELANFAVVPRQALLNPTASPLMITFTQSTVVKTQFHLNDTFPRWTYRLSLIEALPPLNDTPEDYIDVIGVITAISPVCNFRVSNTLTHVMRRRVLLSDHNGVEVGITLWGERAIRFNGKSIHFMGQTDPAVAIFVGATVHTYEGSKELAGGAACKWYINDDIPDVNIFRSNLANSFPPIAHLSEPSKVIFQSQLPDMHPRKSLAHLMNINLYEKEAGVFRCTVRIHRMAHAKKWWATFCTTCSSMSRPATSSSMQPNVYECSRSSCSGTNAMIRYILFLLATDGTGEAEFALYGSVAEQIIGASAMEVLRNSRRDEPPVPNVHVAASLLRKTPYELTRLLSMSCRFIVTVSPNSFFGRWPLFQVRAVESFSAIQPGLSALELHVLS